MLRLPLPLLSLLFASTITTTTTAYAARLDERSNPFGLPALFIRQVNNDACSPLGQKACGANCISLDFSCCPGGSGGCPATAYCALGSNNQYGCCPNGKTCTGAGTAIITPSDQQPTGLSCPAGRKLCGVGCILLTETCCPDGAGGCPIGQSCALGNNGQYGCCPNGLTCTGPGGTSIMQPATVTVTARPSFTTPTGTASLGSATGTAVTAGGVASPTNGSSSGYDKDGDDNDKKKSNIGPIVGGVVGGIAVLGIIGALIFFFVVKPRRSKTLSRPPEATAYQQATEPKPDAGVLAGGAAVAAATSTHHPQAHEMPVQPQQPQQYPTSPQWSPPPSAGYAQPSYPPQGNYPYQQQYQYPQGAAYPPQSPPPPGAYVPQPGQPQNQYYQSYPAGSPAAGAGHNQQPASGYPQQSGYASPPPQQNPPAELPGGTRG